VLHERFGATGKTARVLRVWREESALLAAATKPRNDRPPPEPALPIDIRQLQERLKQAEAHAAEQSARAEVAELREQAHQDRWFLEIDQLREQLRAQPNYAREVRTLRPSGLGSPARQRQGRALAHERCRLKSQKWDLAASLIAQFAAS
jgi:hypothetical protein